MTYQIRQGHVLDLLRAMPDASVHCCCTSPPYWGLRSYGSPPQVWGGDPRCAHCFEDAADYRLERHGDRGETTQLEGSRTHEQTRHGKIAAATCVLCGAWRGHLGLEPTIDQFVRNIAEVFEEVRRVLRPDGTCWVNMGDVWATGAGAAKIPGGGKQGEGWQGTQTQPNRMRQPGLKPKDLAGVPWRVAFALQAAGWWLRDCVIWHKPSAMPSSVRDRFTTAHEYVFLLAKSRRYYFDQDAVREPFASEEKDRQPEDAARALTRLRRAAPIQRQGPAVAGWQRDTGNGAHSPLKHAVPTSHKGSKFKSGKKAATHANMGVGTRADHPEGRNRRSVWTISTEPCSEAHFATFPTRLVEPCILAGCPPGGTVLDPFGGSGTVAVVAERHGRDSILLELNPEYVEIAHRRIERAHGGLFAAVEVEGEAVRP